MKVSKVHEQLTPGIVRVFTCLFFKDILCIMFMRLYVLFVYTNTSLQLIELNKEGHRGTA